MIKLIASDLDGSLLDDDKNLPADFDSVLAGLKEKDVTFVVASGRDFASTEAVFGERVTAEKFAGIAMVLLAIIILAGSTIRSDKEEKTAD